MSRERRSVSFCIQDDCSCKRQFHISHPSRRKPKMKFQVTLEVEVENAATESEARKSAYDLAATLNQAPKKRRGRKGAESVSATASLVGIRVETADGCLLPPSACHLSQVTKDYLSGVNSSDADALE